MYKLLCQLYMCMYRRGQRGRRCEQLAPVRRRRRRRAGGAAVVGGQPRAGRARAAAAPAARAVPRARARAAPAGARARPRRTAQGGASCCKPHHLLSLLVL